MYGININQVLGYLQNFLFQEILKKRNHALENEVVLHLFNIKPNHRVLEVGFGPGIGISAALKRVEHGFGRVYGVDISEQMVSLSSKFLFIPSLMSCDAHTVTTNVQTKAA